MRLCGRRHSGPPGWRLDLYPSIDRRFLPGAELSPSTI